MTAVARAPAESEEALCNDYGTTFRNYKEQETPRQRAVAAFYAEQHKHQTYAFATEQKQRYGALDTCRMTLWEAAELLDTIVDDSDPDLDLPQLQHLLQTAEACRAARPDDDFFHLAGFLHDIGKVLAHSRFGSQPQWAVVGDTHPVGCAFNPSIVHAAGFSANPDVADERFSSPLGVYTPHCGLDALTMSWGHDEYMYHVMKGNGCTMPPAAFAIVRYHSFYAWHRDGAYAHLCNEADSDALAWVKAFNQCDLYSKSIARVDVDALRPYYEGLARKYFPTEVLRW